MEFNNTHTLTRLLFDKSGLNTSIEIHREHLLDVLSRSSEMERKADLVEMESLTHPQPSSCVYRDLQQPAAGNKKMYEDIYSHRIKLEIYMIFYIFFQKYYIFYTYFILHLDHS